LPDLSGAEATAKLLDHVSGTVMADGDLAYPTAPKRISFATTRPGAASNPATGCAPGHSRLRVRATILCRFPES